MIPLPSPGQLQQYPLTYVNVKIPRTEQRIIGNSYHLVTTFEYDSQQSSLQFVSSQMTARLGAPHKEDINSSWHFSPRHRTVTAVWILGYYGHRRVVEAIKGYVRQLREGGSIDDSFADFIITNTCWCDKSLVKRIDCIFSPFKSNVKILCNSGL